MKKTNQVLRSIFAIIILFVISTQVYPHSISGAGSYFGGHDSLLFDGSENSIHTGAGICKVIVERVSGDVMGFVMVTKVIFTCGETSTMTEFIKRKVQVGDTLVLGDEIITGTDGKIALGLPDGSEMRIGPDSKVMVPSAYCDSPGGIKVMLGKIWINVKKQLGKKKYEVNSPGMAVGVRGTQFTIEVITGEDIVKVYEGSVDVRKSNLSNDTKDNAKEYAKLTEDFQAGKITMEEYIKKSKEYQDNISKVMTSKICEAGFMMTVTDNIGEPVKFESTGDEWFDDVNFK